MEIIAVDIGGTHARFAIAEIAHGHVLSLGKPLILKTADFPDLQTAWETFAATLDHPAPQRAGIAFASPINGELLKLTNNPWVIRPAELKSNLKLKSYTLVNDFAAIGHGLSHLDLSQLRHVCGPDIPLPEEGIVSIVGPGTGLGVSMLLRLGGSDHVMACEGGHMSFAPTDEMDDVILSHLRSQYGQVSYERVVSGPGLARLIQALSSIDQFDLEEHVDEKELWRTAINGENVYAVAALERFCMHLGAFAGDMALAHGASATVIGGGLGARLAEILPESKFRDRFVGKGRFKQHMSKIPVKVIVHPEPGLHGAAAAYAQEHCR